VTIRPGFSGTVPIFNDVSRKNNSYTGRPFVPILVWCPGFVPICPSLRPYMLTHRWPKISSDIICIYDKIKIAGVRVGSSRRSPRPQVRPPIDGSRLRRSHSTSTILVLGACLGLRCPNYGHLSPHNTPGYSMLHNQRTFRPGSARPDNKEDRHTCIHLASTVSISTISCEPDRNQFLRISFFVLTWSSVYLGFRCAVPSEANYCWWLQF